MARPIQADSDATRRRIMAAASAMFADRGLDASTMREIARAAGVTMATVHHYHGGKDDLYRACVDAMYREIDGLRDELAQAITAHGTNAPILDLVELAVRKATQFSRRHRPAVQLMQRRILETGELDEERRERYLLPFLEGGSALLAPRLGLPIAEVRFALLAINYIITRLTLSTPRELALVTGRPDATDEEALAATEDALVKLARNQFTAKDHR